MQKPGDGRSVVCERNRKKGRVLRMDLRVCRAPWFSPL